MSTTVSKPNHLEEIEPGKSSITAARPLIIVPNKKKNARATMPNGRLGWLICLGIRITVENRFSMTVPVTIKDEKRTEVGPSCYNNLGLFSREAKSYTIPDWTLSLTRPRRSSVPITQDA